MRLLSCFTLAMFASLGYSQSMLTLADALQYSETGNTTVQRTRSANVTAQNDVTNAQSSLLPSVIWTTDANRVGPNFGGDPDLNLSTRTAYKTRITNTLGAKWTIFDGLGSWANLDSRKINMQATEAHGITLASQVRAQIAVAYFDVSRQQSLQQLRQEALLFSGERLTLAMAKRKIGAGMLLDEQQATLDRNTDSLAWLKAQNAAQQSKRQLNWMLGREVETSFRVDSVIPVDSTLRRDELWIMIRNNSPALREAQLREQAAKSDVRTAWGSVMPSLLAYANYTFLNQYSNPIAPTSSANQGLLVGLTLTMPLYEGGKSVAKLGSARESQTLAEIQLHEVEQQLQRDFAQAYADYTQSIAALKLAEANDVLAKSSLELAMGQYKLGALTSFDLRRIQDSEQVAGNAYYTARFDAMAATIQVKLLAGLAP